PMTLFPKRSRAGRTDQLTGAVAPPFRTLIDEQSPPPPWAVRKAALEDRYRPDTTTPRRLAVTDSFRRPRSPILARGECVPRPTSPRRASPAPCLPGRRRTRSSTQQGPARTSAPIQGLQA